jgi:hypothetical protein
VSQSGRSVPFRAGVRGHDGAHSVPAGQMPGDGPGRWGPATAVQDQRERAVRGAGLGEGEGKVGALVDGTGSHLGVGHAPHGIYAYVYTQP